MPGAAIVRWGLTHKQIKFCRAFHRTGNLSASYKEAYDAENMSDAACRAQASILLDNPNVANRINTLYDETERRNDVTVDKIVAEYSKIGFLDIRKAFDPKGNLLPIQEMDEDTAAAIAGLEVEEINDGRGEDRKSIGRLKKIKLSDKQDALLALGKYLGMFAAERLRIEWDGDPAKLTDTQLQNLLQVLAESIEEEKRKAPKRIEATGPVIETEAMPRSWADITDPEERANIAREWKSKGPEMPTDLSKEDRVAWLDENWPLSSHETTS